MSTSRRARGTPAGPRAGPWRCGPAAPNCISFDTPRNRIRVRIPDQYISTAFAQLVGFDQVRHSAFAIASTRGSGFGGVLPFGMPAGAGSSDGYACVKSGAGGLSEVPCTGPDSGNFGLIDFGFFGSVEIGTTIDCGSGYARRIRFPNNIAVGSDHEVTVKTVSSLPLIDAPDACENGTPGPNSALTETGNNSGILGDGLIGPGTFSDGGPSRLRRTDAAAVRGYRIHHDGGWRADRLEPAVGLHPADPDDDLERRPPVLPAGPVHRYERNDRLREGERPQPVEPPCLRRQPPQVAPGAGPGREAAQRASPTTSASRGRRCSFIPQRCFAHYLGKPWTDGGSFVPGEARTGCDVLPAPCTGAVFSLNSSTTESPDLWDIQYTPRFAYVPELAGSFPSGSSQAVSFARFRATFVQRLTIQNLASPGYFDPGFAAPNGGKLVVNEATVFVFPQAMLPNGLSEDGAPFAVGKNRFVQLVR